MTAVALHKGNVYWELSGWAPKHFPASLKTDVRGRLQDKIMFGTDYPSLPLDRLLQEWEELGFSDKVMHKVFHANAERVLGLPAASPDGAAGGTARQTPVETSGGDGRIAAPRVRKPS
jgi:predicted TIM-barrel fold metal-dependent hydrolase